MFLGFIATNPYYDQPIFNSIFILCAVIYVKTYYDIRLAYIFSIITIIAHLVSPGFDEANGSFTIVPQIELSLLYLISCLIILFTPNFISDTVYTFVLFLSVYIVTVCITIFLNNAFSEISYLELSLLGANVFSLTFIGSIIVTELLNFLQLNWKNQDALIDSLTKFKNRLSLDRYIDYLFVRSRQEYLDECIVIFIDLDDFKRINDTYGHSTGDDVLRYFAKHTKLLSKETDQLFRYGGDEFVIITERNHDQVSLYIQELVVFFQLNPCCSESHSLPIQMSIGYAQFPHENKNIYETLKLADQRMYDHKNAKKAM